MSQQIQLSRLGLCATALILAPVLFELAGIAAADVSSQPTGGGSKVVDPGPRAGPAGAGGPLPGLSADEKALFDAAKVIFMEVDDVAGGLGPRFNLDSCAGCHAAPAVGGSSPAENPQVDVATKDGAKNVVPSFIGKKGPVREARFVRNRDGTITRFGWKAQNKSLLIFAGEAYNVEQGVTNELFPNERETDPSCQYNATPEDHTPMVSVVSPGDKPLDYSSDVVAFAMFMRLLANPVPNPAAPQPDSSIGQGQDVFQNIGCHGCHVIAQTTAKSVFTGQSDRAFFPFSDFALHDMGSKLADGIAQGNASGSEFRTAPLWGVGQRLFFLHDGRTSDLYEAIMAHASKGSEANTVISQFKMLSVADQQALLNYLRSL